MATGFERGVLPCSVCLRSHASHSCALCPYHEALCSRCSVSTRRGVRCIPHFEQRAQMRLVSAADVVVADSNGEMAGLQPAEVG